MSGMAFSGLRARLMLLVLLAVLPAVGLTLYTSHKSGKFAARHTLEDAMRLVQLASMDYERLVEGTRHLLGALARLPAVRNHHAPACNALFADLKTGYPHYANLGAVRPDGSVFCSATPMKQAVNVSDRSYFRRAAETRRFAIGDYQIGRITGKPVVVFGFPGHDKTGRLQVVVFAAIDLTWLNRLAAGVQLPAGTTLTLLDGQGTVLNRWPDPEQWIGKSMADLPLMRAILANPETNTVKATDLDGVQRLYAFAPLSATSPERRVYVSVGVPHATAYAEVGLILTRALAGLAMVATLALAAAWYGGNHLLLQKIKALIDVARRLGQGDLGARTGLNHAHGEIGMLARSFDEMAESLQAREQAIRHMTYHDGLTGLPNRALLLDRLQQAVTEARRRHRQAAVICLDIDRFKFVNETHGHKAGDAVLKAAAERLAACVRAGDTVARLAGDEFAVALSDIAHADDLGRIMKKIMNCANTPLSVEGDDLFVTSSIGVALYPTDGENPDTLLKNAGVAMHQAKQQGGGNYQFYSSRMAAEVAEHLALENGLRRALERQEFVLHYQPQVDLRTGRITGVEALIRWRRPDNGLVPPAKFIPLAEETGLVVPIGEWVLETACAQARAWHTAGLPPVRMAVNISARHFKQPGLDETVGRILRETGLDPHFLEIELTESALAQNPETIPGILGKLEQSGVQISIDDFGTGYSSLSCLKRFPADVLKIDRSFVRNLTTDPDDAAIAAAVIGMAHTLGLRTIAEGVETEEQLEFLRQHRCDAVQGYYFGRPAPAEEIARMLRENRGLAPAARA